MNKLKYIIILFGILDLVTFFRFRELLFNMKESFFNHLNFEIMIVLVLKTLLLVSLVFTFYFSIRNKKIGLIIYYFQFPFRFLGVIFTVGFIYWINSLLSLTTLFIIASLLEFLRLGITIKHHQSFRKETTILTEEILDK